MTHKPEYEDQIALYSLGLLEGEELREIEDHIAVGCGVCAAMLKDSDAVFTNLPLCLEDAPMPKGLEQKILDRLEPREPAGGRSSIFDFWKNLSPLWLNLGAAASLAVIIFLVATNISLRNELNTRQKSLADLQAKLVKEAGFRTGGDYVDALSAKIEAAVKASISKVQAEGKKKTLGAEDLA